jgi:methyl-accepting chemotaxis protein
VKLNQLTIGVRLGAAFGLVVLITALVALVGVLRVESLRAAIEHQTTFTHKREVIANRWAADIGLNAVRAVAVFHGSPGDLNYATELQREMKTTSESISEGSSKIMAASGDPVTRTLHDDVHRTR